MSTNVAIPVRESSDVGAARRAAAALSRALDLDPTVAGQAAIVVTEAATNLVKHGGGGAILLNQIGTPGAASIEILAIDKGPGMDDVEHFMADGYSTAGSPGNGLGAIARLSTFHEIYSHPGLGTVVLAHLGNPRRDDPPPRFQVGAISVSKGAEPVCGDAWVTEVRDHGLRIIVVDGLGHGFGAFEASKAALDIAAAHSQDAVLPLLERIHAGLRSTRGAAVSVAEIDPAQGSVTYAGLGNVAGSLVSPGGPRRQMISYNGTAGHNAHKIRDLSYPWAPDMIVILHSDGLATHWTLDKYPGLHRSHPTIIAAILFRDFQRGTDDATVVVVRFTGSPQENRS
ncbi:MAG TPA: SpoIIE family protein phosphatase [Candidatus Solibacter sp.]